jgi:hypothetical protein
MKIPALLVLVWALTAGAAPDSKKSDWRIDLLTEEGIEHSDEALKKAMAGTATSKPTFEAAYRNLAAEEFSEREQAERELLRGGREALEWLQDQEPSQDPEVILDQISLDRSGRTGGNALFDEFTLEVIAP